MKSNRRHLFALALAAATAAPIPALAFTDQAAFDERVKNSRPATASAGQWVNAILPTASGEPAAVAAGRSADEQFMQSIAYYTRAMLDRAGWVNPYAPAPGYASGNYLVAVLIGEGVTIMTFG